MQLICPVSQCSSWPISNSIVLLESRINLKKSLSTILEWINWTEEHDRGSKFILASKLHGRNKQVKHIASPKLMFCITYFLKCYYTSRCLYRMICLFHTFLVDLTISRQILHILGNIKLTVFHIINWSSNKFIKLL